MIDFEGIYSVDAERVEFISMRSGTGEAPYGLFLTMRSGKELGLWYRTEFSRKQGKERIVREIECDRRREELDIQERLTEIMRVVERTEKRQLRIWRQLKELLSVDPVESI